MTCSATWSATSFYARSRAGSRLRLTEPSCPASAATSSRSFPNGRPQPKTAEVLASRVAAGCGRPLRGARAEDPARPQHRSRSLSARRRRDADAARQCRCRALPCQGRWTPYGPLLRSRDGSPLARALRAAARLCARPSHATSCSSTISRRPRSTARCSGSRLWSRWRHPKLGVVLPSEFITSPSRTA